MWSFMMTCRANTGALDIDGKCLCVCVCVCMYTCVRVPVERTRQHVHQKLTLGGGFLIFYSLLYTSLRLMLM